MEESNFAMFMSSVIQKLESLLTAPSGSFIFAKHSQTIKCSHSYFFRELSLYGTTFRIGFRTDWPTQCGGYRFLLNLAIQEICDLVLDDGMFRSNADATSGKWAYDYFAHDWHTSDTLARQVYELVSQQAFSWIHQCLGLDPLVMSHIADMSYETDTARGMFVFQTGKLDSNCETYQLCPKPNVYFTKESERFIRKQLAGAGEDCMLFTRESADCKTGYKYCGYLVLSKSGAISSKKKLPISALLMRSGGWVLQINEQPILYIKHRDVYLPSDDLDAVRKTIDAEFGLGTAEKVSVVLEALRTQKHGTSVIFLDLKDQASLKMMTRLEENGRALRIEDAHINKEGAMRLERLLKQVSRVDGAQICDINSMCVCYVNAIVDGIARIPGRRECGARHNALESAIANLAAQDSTKKVKAVAVIFSEDGGISSVSASQCRRLLKDK